MQLPAWRLLWHVEPRQNVGPAGRLPITPDVSQLRDEFGDQIGVDALSQQIQIGFDFRHRFGASRKFLSDVRLSHLRQTIGELNVRIQVVGLSPHDFEKTADAPRKQTKLPSLDALSKPNFGMIASLIGKASTPLQELAEVAPFHNQATESSLCFSEFRANGQHLSERCLSSLRLVVKDRSTGCGQCQHQVGNRLLVLKPFHWLVAPKKLFDGCDAQQFVHVALTAQDRKEEMRCRFPDSAGHLQHVTELLVGLSVCRMDL